MEVPQDGQGQRKLYVVMPYVRDFEGRIVNLDLPTTKHVWYFRSLSVQCKPSQINANGKTAQSVRTQKVASDRTKCKRAKQAKRPKDQKQSKTRVQNVWYWKVQQDELFFGWLSGKQVCTPVGTVIQKMA